MQQFAANNSFDFSTVDFKNWYKTGDFLSSPCCGKVNQVVFYNAHRNINPALDVASLPNLEKQVLSTLDRRCYYCN